MPILNAQCRTFLEDRALYPIPVDAAGKAGTPVDIWMDRAANGKLIVAENASVKISVITVNGDKASVEVVKDELKKDGLKKDGLKTPTAVQPAGDTLWIAERGEGNAVSIPMPK
jgi:hypothetical protein